MTDPQTLPIQRYTPLAQALHWVTAALMFAVLPLAWVMTSLPHDDPGAGLLFMLHKSIGVTIFVLVAARLAWRARHPAPPLAASRLVTIAAFASHWLLYLVLIVMPVSGYVMSAASGHPVSWFGLITLPGLPKDETVAKTGAIVHLTTQWAVYALIVLHLGATAWHVAVRRDGVLDRMLPEQK
jgi:cytochrome b561